MGEVLALFDRLLAVYGIVCAGSLTSFIMNLSELYGLSQGLQVAQ